MVEFQKADYPRRDFSLKEVRNDLLGAIGTSKSWEDAVGFAIAQLTLVEIASPDSLQAYLGDGLCRGVIVRS